MFAAVRNYHGQTAPTKNGKNEIKGDYRVLLLRERRRRRRRREGAKMLLKFPSCVSCRWARDVYAPCVASSYIKSQEGFRVCWVYAWLIMKGKEKCFFSFFFFLSFAFGLLWVVRWSRVFFFNSQDLLPKFVSHGRVDSSLLSHKDYVSFDIYFDSIILNLIVFKKNVIIRLQFN